MGEEDFMLCGDGPGLLDAYRGAAMDKAATCVRIAAQAVRAAEKSIPPAMTHYSQKMKLLKHQMETNKKKCLVKFAPDEILKASFAPQRALIDGLKMVPANPADRVLHPERMIKLSI